MISFVKNILLFQIRIIHSTPHFFEVHKYFSQWQITLISHSSSCGYANFSRLFLSAFLYDLSVTLQGDKFAFGLYDALKIYNTCSFSFLQFCYIQNTADLRVYTKYEL